MLITPVWWGRFLLFCVPQRVKTKETNPTRPGFPLHVNRPLGLKGLNGKKEIRNSLFQVLEGGLEGGKILKSFSVTQQTSYTSSNSSCTILL